MADPISIIGAIAAILDIGKAVVSLIESAKDASTDRQKLLVEIRSMTTICQILKDCAEVDTESWTMTLTLLNGPNGLIQQIQSILEYLLKKLAPSRNRASQLLKWTLSRQEVQEVLRAIDRQKGLLILALVNDNVKLSQDIRDKVDDVVEGFETILHQQKLQSQTSSESHREVQTGFRLISGQVDSVQQQQHHERNSRILSQLTTIDFEAAHGGVSSRRTYGTGKWLLESPEYTLWSDGDPAVLACQGIPGAGKTTLASLVIDSLRGTLEGPWASKRQTNITGVAGIYCSYREPQPVANMIGSVLQQLLEPLDQVPNSARTNLRLQNISTIMSDILRYYQKVYIIVDALDECRDRIELLRVLKSLLVNNSSPPSRNDIRILVTSRVSVTVDIERDLSPDKWLEIRGSDEDMRAFLHEAMGRQDLFAECIGNDFSFEESAIDSILARSSGMFLLARLYVDLLSNATTKRSLRKSLLTLPQGINDTYTRAWERICGQIPEQASVGRRVIMWIIYATRPLRIQEVQHALAVERGDEELDQDGIVEASKLVSFCAGFVYVHGESNMISLIHPTTQAFFEDRKERLFPRADEMIAATCVTYLCMRPFRDEGALDEPRAFHERCSSSLLLSYAAVNWGLHVSKANSERGIELAICLLKTERARLAAAQALSLNGLDEEGRGREWPAWSEIEGYAVEYESNPFKASKLSTKALRLAAYFDLIDVAKVLLQGHTNINEVDETSRTALHWSFVGHGRRDRMLLSLLQWGADPNVKARMVSSRRWSHSLRGGLPITAAASWGNVEAVEHLLKHGSTMDEALYTALCHICSVNAVQEYFGIARKLIEHGADLTSNPRIMNIAGLLNPDGLKLVIHANMKRQYLQQVLETAICHGRVENVAYALKCGANPDDMKGTDLVQSSDSGPEKTGRIQNAPTIINNKPLDAMPPKGRNIREDTDRPENNISRNLSDGVSDNVSRKIREYPRITLLVYAITCRRAYDSLGLSRCISLFIDGGVDANHICPDEEVARDFWGWNKPLSGKTTPLHIAASYAELDVIRYLVGKGAEINFRIREHYTALTSALECENHRMRVSREEGTMHSLFTRSTLQVLVELGADIDLCSPDDKQRIEQLLTMSDEECDAMNALQNAAFYPFPSSYSKGSEEDRNRPNLRVLKTRLENLIRNGADRRLCCTNDQPRINHLLGKTEEELAKDEDRCDKRWRNDREQVRPTLRG